MIEYKTTEGDNGRFSAVSTITLRPSPEDNGVVYSCQALHHKLEPPLISTVRLSVLCKCPKRCTPNLKHEARILPNLLRFI